jgi:chromate transport protein ChrA
MMIERAQMVLSSDGWSAFSDPWFPELNGGAALFRQYPHLPHQLGALIATTTRINSWTVLAGLVFLGVFLVPLCFYLGARILGFSGLHASIAAFVAATARCMDPFGHDILAYGLTGKGLFGQLWGMNIAVLALAVWVASSTAQGAGLKDWARWARFALGALLISATLRTSLPASWLLVLCSLTAVLFLGPRSALRGRMRRFMAVGAGGAVLSLGFLVPFLTDLATANQTALEMQPELAQSVGAKEVLSRLAGGHYFDGGTAGLWTLLLICGLLSPAFFWKRKKRGRRITSGLALAGLISLLLLFGRATWGDWINPLPLVGRFHDHRYLLGLQLVAPWLIASVVVSSLHWLSDRTQPVLVLGVGGVALALAVGPVLVDLQMERAFSRGTQTSFDSSRTLLDQLVAKTEQDFPHRVALARPDGMIGGTSWLSWLRREGALTMGRPLHHYHHVHDFSLWWSRWVSAVDASRDRPVHPEDLTAAGVRRLFDPRRGAGTVEGHGPILVRSDLLITASSPRLDGVEIRWFQEGLHLDRQYPAVSFPGLSPASNQFTHTTRLEQRDVGVFQRLPRRAHPTGNVVSSYQSIPLRVTAEVTTKEVHTWLLLPHAWHPRWEVRVNGEPHPFGMLLPGWIGVPLSQGTSEVELHWPVSPVRGGLAALNLLVQMVLIFLLITRRLAEHRP